MTWEDPTPYGDAIIVVGDCFTCGRVFGFNPVLVPSVPIDPTTELPPDIGNTDPANAVRQPLCPDCVERINERRVALGLEPVYVFAGAYEPTHPGVLDE